MASPRSTIGSTSNIFGADFCFTNLAKIQTKSIIHNRILLDIDHFISNKWHYYQKFKNYDFIPSYIKFNIDEPFMKIKYTDAILLKPDNGSLSSGIKIFKKYIKNDMINHINMWKQFTSWTISKLYISKLWNNYIVSNRIYYLVRKMKIKDDIHISGYWFDELIHYRAYQTYVKLEDLEENNYDEYIKIYVTNYDTESTPFEYFKKRVINHKDYLTCFDKKEYDIIKTKITNNLTIITEQIANHAICSNDYITNYDDNDNRNITFHLYGVDSIITDDLSVKFIEINGAPSIKNCGGKYINYNVMMNEILKLTTDILFEPLQNVTYDKSNNGDYEFGKFKDSMEDVKLFDRKFIEAGNFTKKMKLPVYFIRDIHEKYPFIVDGFFNKNGQSFGCFGRQDF